MEGWARWHPPEFGGHGGMISYAQLGDLRSEAMAVGPKRPRMERLSFPGSELH